MTLVTFEVPGRRPLPDRNYVQYLTYKHNVGYYARAAMQNRPCNSRDGVLLDIQLAIATRRHESLQKLAQVVIEGCERAVYRDRQQVKDISVRSVSVYTPDQEGVIVMVNLEKCAGCMYRAMCSAHVEHGWPLCEG